LFQNWMVSKFT